MNEPVELVCARTDKGCKPDCVILDPNLVYVVTHGDHTTRMLNHERVADLKSRPWMAVGAMTSTLHSNFDPHLYVKTGITNDPVSAIRAWLIEAGADEHECYALFAGNTEVMVFRVGKPAPQASKQVPAGHDDRKMKTAGRFVAKRKPKQPGMTK